MNVQELTDTELNRAMIWLYPIEGWYGDYATGIKVTTKDYLGFLRMEYLQDWNLTMPLAVKEELEVEFMPVTTVRDGHGGVVRSNNNPLRAICEVLVMIKLEQPL